MKKRVLVGLCAVMAVIVAGCEGVIPGDSDGPGDGAVTGVTLNASLVLGVNDTATLTATVVPGNAANTAVTWASDNEAVATVDAETGTVTGVAKGSAVITVTSADGGKTDTCAVTVVFAVAASAEDWNSALEKISGAEDGISGNPKIFDIYITGDFETAGIPSNSSSITGSHKEVRLTGTKTIALSGTGSLIRTAVNQNQTFVIDGPTLQGNSGNNAPLVYINSKSTVELLAGTIQGNNNANESLPYGGGVFVSGGTFTMKGGSVSGNTASAGPYLTYGGGVSVNSGTFTMEGGTVSGNRASDGGGVYISGGTFTMKDGTISGNTGSRSGGGVSVNSGTFTMEGGTIGGNDDNSKNTAREGGGVYVNYGTFTMGGEAAVSGNTATDSSGGGVYVYSGTFTMESGTVSGNTARYGGGMHVYSNATFTMKSGTVSGNTATGGGGGGVHAFGTFTMAGGTVSGNTADKGGGGVFASEGTFTMTGGTISGNTARALSYDNSLYGNGYGGGGVFVSGTFTKAPATDLNTSGVIYGYTEGDPNSNKIVNADGGAILSDKGHAVRVFIGNNTFKKRDAMAGPGDVMYRNVNDQADTGWEE